MTPGAGAAPQALPAAAALPEPLLRYLGHLRVERKLAERTLALYTDALARLVAGLAEQGAELHRTQPHHILGLVTQLHGQGLSPRSLALQLSAWRGFFRWWGREGGVKLNPVQGLRAPKAGKPLPKALAVDQAVALAQFQSPHGRPALLARDHAITELLYGCGLRVAELVGLDVRASGAAAGWLDADDALAHVLGKGHKRRSVPVGSHALQALAAWLPHRATLAHAGETALFVSQDRKSVV
jgi:integrase/recombinase XerC